MDNNNSTQPAALPKEVADKYDLVHIQVGKHFVPGFGIIDLETLALERADKLVERGFKYLVEKAGNALEPATTISVQAQPVAAAKPVKLAGQSDAAPEKSGAAN